MVKSSLPVVVIGLITMVSVVVTDRTIRWKPTSKATKKYTRGETDEKV